MHIRPGFAVGLTLFVGILVGSCASGGRPGRARVPGCPGFVITENQIHVTPAGGTFQLGGNNQITFDPDAVTTNTTFSVAALMVNNQQVAGVRFEPAVAEFPEPVRLRLSYAGCPDILQNEDKRLFIGIIGADGEPSSIGGAKSKQQNTVEADVPHFTDFAIAM